ncbi:AsmA family protein [Ensifer soli]|uniref:AsmA family protein n=1 Tax=Ciceribacter sp. sgz301302 TaxID=3342379 RepID=UPI0035BB1B4C
MPLFAFLKDPRLLVGLAAGAAALVLFYLVALPAMLARIDLQGALERTLADWTGAEVDLAGPPSLALWPHPTLTLSGVTLRPPGEAEPIATIGRVEAEFDLGSAFLGLPEFDAFVLTDPVVTLARSADGRLNWPGGTPLARAFADAADGRADGEQPPIGKITVENGAVSLEGFGEGPTRMSAIEGVLRWPRPDARLSLRARATLNGQTVDLRLASDAPARLFSGSGSSLDIDLTAPLMALAFEGTAGFGANGFGEGHLQFSSPSLRKLAGWLAGELPETPESEGRPLTADATVTMTGGTMRLDTLQMTLGTAVATGVLDLQDITGAMPRLIGTLAFDTVDLQALVPSGAPVRIPPVLGHVGLDLRVSANRLVAGALALTDVAAGVMVDARGTVVDIGDATLAEGTLTGRLLRPRDGAEPGRLTALLKDADLAELPGLAALDGPRLAGRGDLQAELSIATLLSGGAPQGVSGRLRLSGLNGRIEHVDVPAFVDRATGGGFFPLSAASAGAFAFTTLDMDASVDGGTITLEGARAEGTEGVLTLSGVLRPANGSVALAGRLNPAVGPLTGGSVRFFAGGAWPDLTITPLSVLSEAP